MDHQEIFKITYHLGAKKINAYLKNPSRTSYYALKKQMELCLFEERKQPRCEVRLFWIDEEHDEIDIVNQCDYDIFMVQCPGLKHLQAAPIDSGADEPAAGTASKSSVTATDSKSNQAKIPPAAGSYDFAVHNRIECDACLMAPIIGFRYKCIQCPNYDLCQNCESKHIHPEHMMVRMPTNHCPDVIEAYVAERASGRKHGKRSKTSCPFVKNGLSVVVDDDTDVPNSGSGENSEQLSSAIGKDRHHGRKFHRRHNRNNIFSHFCEMMQNLAEGGSTATADHSMGESTSSSKTTTSTTGAKTATTTTVTSNTTGFEKQDDLAATAATAAIAQIAAQKAHETAVTAAKIAAKVAHETAFQAAKNMTENITAAPSPPTSANATEDGEKEKGATNEKGDETTSTRDPEPQSVSLMPTPSLESLAQFLDPHYMKTGIQILNNFSDMFAKMLDPMENIESINDQIYTNSRKSSTTSTKPSESPNLNSLGRDKSSDEEKSIEKDQNKEKTNESKQSGSDTSSQVEICDLGSDSENESASESFVKLYAPKKGNVATSPHTTPPQSLDKSNVMDFTQLGAVLKSHIAEEAAKDSLKSVGTTTESVENANEALNTMNSTTVSIEPVISTTSTSTTSNAPGKPEEKRAVIVYHADQRVNNAVHAMLSMGFSNEGAYLTQLLESVNGNIAEALDLMSAAQRDGTR